MYRHNLVSRLTIAFAGAFALFLFSACAGQVKVSTSATPAPVAQTQPVPQPQPPAQPQPPVRPKLPEPVVRRTAYELFDMGQEGEDKYKGKVVGITGMVDVTATKRPGPGGTSTLVVQAKAGEPPYAIATFGHDSEELLFGGRYQPPSVYLCGTYRGRDERGTVLLDDAKVMSCTTHMPAFDFRREDPRKPRKTPPDKKKTPVIISAEQLAQGLQDDLATNYPRYYGAPLQIDGVIAKQSQDKGTITMIQFEPSVKDKKTGKAVEFTIFCGLRKPVSIGSSDAAGLAVGQRVKLLGNLSAAGNGQATLNSCVIVKQGRAK